MDVHQPKTRSYNMSRIKGKNTKPELVIRKLLWRKGYRYRIHYRKLPGKPDLVFPGRKKVVFINGCFWHKHDCKYFKWPETNSNFWQDKINRTAQRDNENYETLKRMGWHSIIIWECKIKNNITEAIDEIEKFLK